ncbi:unnamed protein product [Spodoptera exigua]|nr:unnamed protein product [Spodoptera exigua]
MPMFSQSFRSGALMYHGFGLDQEKECGRPTAASGTACARSFTHFRVATLPLSGSSASALARLQSTKSKDRKNHPPRTRNRARAAPYWRSANEQTDPLLVSKQSALPMNTRNRGVTSPYFGEHIEGGIGNGGAGGKEGAGGAGGTFHFNGNPTGTSNVDNGSHGVGLAFGGSVASGCTSACTQNVGPNVILPNSLIILPVTPEHFL